MLLLINFTSIVFNNYNNRVLSVVSYAIPLVCDVMIMM